MESITNWKEQREMEKRFIKNLVFCRTLNGWTQQQAAEQIGHGLKRSLYGAWEERRSFPSIFFCHRIAEVFREDLTEMLTKTLEPGKG